MQHAHLRWDLSQHKIPINIIVKNDGDTVIVPSWDDITGNPIAVSFVLSGGAGTVDSVFGRTGAVIAQTGDYTASQVGAPPTSRTLTINSVAYDLSANRSWTVGDLLSSGSYSNPSWITSLAWSKISSSPTTLSGYGITNAVANTRTLTINGTTYDLSADRSWTVSGSVGALDDLTDVTITAVASGNLLRYSGTEWINAMLSSGDIPSLDMSKITTGNLDWSRITSAPSFITSAAISTLTDVTITSLTTNDWLRYNGTKWVNTQPTTLSGFGITDAVAANSSITGATKTKITYDAKGLVTSGADATTADIADSTNKRYVTDANLFVLNNTSNTNTGDETATTIKVKIGPASSTLDGYLLSTDWNIFNNKQNADVDLAALASNSTTGLWTVTGAGTGAARTVTAGSGQINITNGNGVSGNPTVDLNYASALRETSGPTTLTSGSISDGQILKRVGTTIVGVWLALNLTVLSVGDVMSDNIPVYYGSSLTIVPAGAPTG